MSLQLPKFYPIASSYQSAETYILAGVKFLQIRLKDFSSDDTQLQLAKAVTLAKYHHVHLVINDFWQDAITLKANWVHLGQEDLQTANINAIRNAGIKFGLSTHDDDELQTAIAYNPDYIALGPVYFTKLKAMKWSPQGLDKVKQWKQKCGSIPLVAIGGITLEKAQAVLDAGADCVSFVTDITHHVTPEQRLQEWLEAF